MANLESRIVQIEAKVRINQPLILFKPELRDHDKDEQTAHIKRLIKTGRHVILLSDGDGWATWKDGKCITDGGLQQWVSYGQESTNWRR